MSERVAVSLLEDGISFLPSPIDPTLDNLKLIAREASKSFWEKQKAGPGSTVYLSYLCYFLLTTSNKAHLGKTNATICICAKNKICLVNLLFFGPSDKYVLLLQQIMSGV